MCCSPLEVSFNNERKGDDCFYTDVREVIGKVGVGGDAAVVVVSDAANGRTANAVCDAAVANVVNAVNCGDGGGVVAVKPCGHFAGAALQGKVGGPPYAVIDIS
ncbi:Hypothetical predicted protein [Octopus vulgaris]|uniref:Uncharacterized protein n=1 Tax=Octopus vulgaris TaxID=6645 RepID=A0AA36B5K4_OCTVU|nr:Hypothetical predicted protein [Octopus vulgaris]